MQYNVKEPSLCAAICSKMIAYFIITQLAKQATQTQLHSCDTAVRISPIYSVRRHRASSDLIKTREKKREKGRERKIKIAHRHPHKYRNRIILMSFTPLTMFLWIFSPLPFHLTPNPLLLPTFVFSPSLLFTPITPSAASCHLCHFTPHFLHLSIFLQTISQSWLLFSCYGDWGIEGLKMASSFSPLLFSGCPGPRFPMTTVCRGEGRS